MIIKGNTFNAHTPTCVNHKVTPSCTFNSQQSLHLAIVLVILLEFQFTISIFQKKIAIRTSIQWCDQKFCFRTLDLRKAKGDWTALSMTLPSGEAPKYGASRLTTSPDFRTLTVRRIECMYFCYCSRATGSYLIPWLVYRDENGLGCSRLFAKVSWFLLLALIKPKFEAVNLNFLSCFHSSQFDCPRVLVSISLIFSSSTRSFSSKAFSIAAISSGTTNSSVAVLSGNLGWALVWILWVWPGSILGTEEILQYTLKYLQ